MGVGRQDTTTFAYELEIESYRKLSESTEVRDDGYKSFAFKACDHSWKLDFYPTGKKKRSGEDHISLYLKMVDTNNHPCCSVWVNFSFYVLDHKAGKYVSFPDSVGMVKKFEEGHCEWGCEQFLSVASFQSKGYMKDDSAMFGVEIFPIKSRRVKEILYSPPYSWSINNYSVEGQKNCITSDEFRRGGRKWKLRFYPKGRGEGKNEFVSVYLDLNDINNVSEEGPVNTDFAVQVIDQSGRKKDTHNYQSSSCACGWSKFMLIKDLDEKIKDNTVTIEAEFFKMSVVKIN